MNFMDFIVGFELSGSTESFSDKEKEKSTAESKVTTKSLCNKKVVTTAELIARLRHDLNINTVSFTDGMGGIYEFDAENFWDIINHSLENYCAESLKAEKKCECKCKSNQDFCKELLGQIKQCKKMLGERLSAVTFIYFTLTFFDIENKLQAEIEKSDTAKSCQCAEKDCTYYIRNGTYYMPKQMSYAEWKKRLTDDEINEALENGIRGDQIIYLPKTEKEKIIKLIDKCFEIIDKQSDVDFIRIKEHLIDILCVLAQYK